MSVLVVGISHRSAPVALLERVAIDDDGVQKLMADASSCDHVSEATVIATCNRVEIYTEVDRFHGSVESLSRLLVDRAGGDDRGDAAAPLRPLRRRRDLAPVPGRRRPRLDGPRRGPDPRPDPGGAAPRPGARHRRSGPQHAVPAGAPGRQAHPRRDRDRPGRADSGDRRPRPGRRCGRRRARQGRRRTRRRRDGRAGHRHRRPDGRPVASPSSTGRRSALSASPDSTTRTPSR